jgi:hypothetical protein
VKKVKETISLVVVISVILIAVAMVTSGYLIYNAYNKKLCVIAGEPLFPSTERVPLTSFIEYYSHFGYNITLISNTTVVICSAKNIGSTNLHEIEFPVVSC